ncbi:MAG: hypothetical protein UR26_C0002G0195 [candidate division TM6 bacterium GW2011_GWF2_32_72]|nr:MAG: hypothetical protein UR26_C0002G0195 [candidate division TM6 bacterium GW2011_GWF2_32_72]
MEKTLNIFDSIVFGYKKFWQSKWALISLGAILYLINKPSFVVERLAENNPQVTLLPLLSLAVDILSLIVISMIMPGIIQILLEAYNDKISIHEITFSKLFSKINLTPRYALGFVIYGLICLGGTILVIIPGIIWGIKYCFWIFILIDKNLSAWESIKFSGKITYGYKKKLLILLLASPILAIITFLIGFFPCLLLICIHLYKQLLSFYEEKHGITN